MEYRPLDIRAKSDKKYLRRHLVLLATFGLVIGAIGGVWYWVQFLKAPGGELSVRDISDFELDQVSGTAADIPAKFRKLDGQRITLTGRMWNPIGTDKGVGNFQLTFIRDSEQRPPLGQDFVACAAETPMQYYDDEVRATGIFHIRIIRRDGIIASVFSLNVDQVKPVDEKKPPGNGSERASFLDIY